MRGLTANVLAEIAKQRVRPVVFVEAQFFTGKVYLWSGLGTASWNGQTWMGVGKLGSISAVTETSDVTPVNLVLSLSGIPSDLLAQVLTEVRTGFPVRVWFGFMDESNAVIADPYQAFAGRMDVVELNEGAETSIVAITVENVLVDLQRPRPVRYTDQAQQAEFPGDKGFEYVPQLQELQVNWGSKGANVAPVGGGGSGSGGGGGGRTKAELYDT